MLKAVMRVGLGGLGLMVLGVTAWLMVVRPAEAVAYERNIVYSASADTDSEDVYLVNFSRQNHNLTLNSAWDDYPDTAPDGSQVAFVSQRDGRFDLFVMEPDGSKLRNLTQFAPINRPYAVAYPLWSPDSEWIAYVSNYHGETELRVMRADGSASRRVGNYPSLNYGQSFSWSPDSEWLVFPERDNNRYSLMVARRNGNDPRILSQALGGMLHPRWSPDGMWIVLAAYEFGILDVYLVPADGSAIKRNLTNSRGNNSYPMWSPDGEWIVFVSDRTRGVDIYKMRPDGSHLQKLTDSPRAVEWQPRWSSHGDWILFGRASCAHCGNEIWKMDADGNRARLIATYQGDWTQRDLDWGAARSVGWRSVFNWGFGLLLILGAWWWGAIGFWVK